MACRLYHGMIGMSATPNVYVDTNLDQVKVTFGLSVPFA